MQKPSDQWKKLRQATLERAYRKLAQPLEPVLLLLLICSSVYLSVSVVRVFRNAEAFS